MSIWVKKAPGVNTRGDGLSPFACYGYSRSSVLFGDASQELTSLRDGGAIDSFSIVVKEPLGEAVKLLPVNPDQT
jgi:hypothetical protein